MAGRVTSCLLYSTIPVVWRLERLNPVCELVVIPIDFACVTAFAKHWLVKEFMCI
jgi:hypothetical protein